MPDIPDLLRRIFGTVDAAGAAFDQIERANGQLASELASPLSDKADLRKRIRDVVCQGRGGFAHMQTADICLTSELENLRSGCFASEETADRLRES
jgi:hypothetical protein